MRAAKRQCTRSMEKVRCLCVSCLCPVRVLFAARYVLLICHQLLLLSTSTFIAVIILLLSPCCTMPGKEPQSGPLVYLLNRTPRRSSLDHGMQTPHFRQSIKRREWRGRPGEGLAPLFPLPGGIRIRCASRCVRHPNPLRKSLRAVGAVGAVDALDSSGWDSGFFEEGALALR